MIRSVPGQTEKNSVRAYVFRFTLKLGHGSMHSACPKSAMIGRVDPKALRQTFKGDAVA
jgi:hypothetical protein